MGKLILVTGGARSGKSTFAEKYVLNATGKCAYIATAEILDEEMAERVKLHQARRNNGRWVNFEGYYDAEKIFPNLGADIQAVLFDCLTLYMTNYMYGKGAIEGDFQTRIKYVLQKIEILLAAAKKSSKTVVFVTNEVGSGIVPDNVISREYRDLNGWVNQRVAEVCDEVYVCFAGIAVDFKKLGCKI